MGGGDQPLPSSVLRMETHWGPQRALGQESQSVESWGIPLRLGAERLGQAAASSLRVGWRGHPTKSEG